MEHPVKVTLEELMGGVGKKMKVKRRRINKSTRESVQEERLLSFTIPPGARNGTKIRFAEEGNEVPNMTPADVVFILTEQPHNLFIRDEYNLRTGVKIDLKLALFGGNLIVSLTYDKSVYDQT